MGSDWIESLDKRPTDRTGYDLDLIFSKLKEIKAFENFQPMLLQQLCYYCYYENLDKGVTLFRYGDIGTNWYVCLSGTVDVVVPSDSNKQTDNKIGNQTAICTLGAGTAFGESIIYDMTRNATIITADVCELLRVEQKDFRILWDKNREYMKDVIMSLSRMSLSKDSNRRYSDFDQNVFFNSASRLQLKDDPRRNPALPIVPYPSSRITNSACILKSAILSTAPHLIKNRIYHMKTHESCLVGSEMVDWLIHTSPIVFSRSLAVGMWQALLEENTISHVSGQHYFKDKYLLYRFTSISDESVRKKSTMDKASMVQQLTETIELLSKIGPDATLRMILRKQPQERTSNDLDIIYEELANIKALSHFSSVVKKELATYLFFESHHFSNTPIFRQGEEGKSWYIILKGSVDVSIYGKNVVTTLHEGEEFGRLSLVNNCPRSATITTRENNCHFLRVEKEDFNRIIKDCDAFNVQLKEFDKIVLTMQKQPFRKMDELYGDMTVYYKYSLTSGTPEKILEHLLETQSLVKTGGGADSTEDTFLEDFLMTHMIFLPTVKLCPLLISYYNMFEITANEQLLEVQPSTEEVCNRKRKVVRFVKEWSDVAKDAFFEDSSICQMMDDMYTRVKADAKLNPNLREELRIVETIIESSPYNTESTVSKKVKVLWRNGSQSIGEMQRKPIRSQDENIFKIYFADHTYTTVKLTMEATANQIISTVCDKVGLIDHKDKDQFVLCEVRSNGDRYLFKNNNVSINTSLSINGRFFLSPVDHLEAITPLPEQEGPMQGTWSILEMFESKEIAYVITCYDWGLFNTVHPYELIYQVFGRHKFNKITANLDLFIRRFNEVQYWVCTEICLCQNLGKRVSLLRKFIKVASYCKSYQNLNTFFAIIMGLSNVAVSRLSNTWEKLPNKFKKIFAEFERLMDPSRNHRQYRLLMESLKPPIVPFLPLLIKDMTFIHEGNKTFSHGLVNYDKIRLLASTIGVMKKCRSNQLVMFFMFSNLRSKNQIVEYQNSKLFDWELYPKQYATFSDPNIDLNDLKARTQQTKIILLWNSFFGLEFNRDACPINNCLFTYDRNKFQDKADLVVVHMRNEIDKLPPKNSRRPAFQRWVFGLYESQENTDNYAVYNGYFNLSATFLRESEFNGYYLHPSKPFNVKNLEWRSNIQYNQQLEKSISEKNKTKTVAALISNCGSYAGSQSRLTYINSLKNYLNVDIFGRGSCATSGECPEKFRNGTTGTCKQIIGQEYKFFLSFENSICRDYITEKFFEILPYDIVPVVMGAGEYHKYVPKSGYINALDFKSSEDLARYLIYLDSNTTAYRQYFAWKRHVVFMENKADFFCTICFKLHLESLYGIKRGVLNDLGKMWNKAKDCRSYPLS